ncbi:hypothetical protein Desor_1431 [Desulfosporosinus orientis DSM 765]|uniref:B3/B4 tRNA-binding domain-containing protein n=1 Tax=Desulfosporosinus orientis (strain ATCC 19365 / DSM 765 / NCIMB 8382 / VKM B-1628 / Singapore I) TaxID=768706 RepID=G7W8E8_DESOD|nr:phenylalanine--tRNA ligase beta subunit-related protein [Desulfosporosinus orientis]AET67088.1 hypothetical protein Desor_1431 [Desulfosporosinus orientis DSM 765]
MIDFSISQELKDICPEVVLGCIQAKVTVQGSSDSLWKEIESYCDVLKQDKVLENLVSESRIIAGREAYKKLGKVPSKYRTSSEALIRRVLQGKGVYRINNIVDINNLLSLKSKFPVGSYNVDNIHSPVVLGIGKPGEQYKGIGKELINIENLPVLKDNLGSFGSPTSDSERAMITNSAQEIVICIFSFSGDGDILEYLKDAEMLLEEFADGKNIKTIIIK